MQLLVLITHQTEKIPEVLAEFVEKGIKGATIVDCQGMLEVLRQSPVKDMAMLAQFAQVPSTEQKMMMVLLSDWKLQAAKDAIHRQIGILNRPNVGVMFTLPLLAVEGVPEE